ncbi:M20/M25/M40 family metallo-hydrolase [Paraliomyxa miuraensis]|uniref:M20/M25/M40 family metallo-hydrolase n=1 Tax=Paraliomyxa miuraensis TaxID=376150 RepID=UPI002251CFD6|nr:M20/M25/M40 family metallo-hydrolase [Paraliomyxa miuraensis]MCX4241936.1 M20/M25/M40 family metallo-hydrolase [Paraliomyxa miuraensis]
MGNTSDGLNAKVDQAEPWFRAHLRTLVEHKTVSPGKTGDDDIRAGAEAARRLMQEAGGEAELVECSGTPSVLARFTHPQPRARIVVYNHLDVQPADPRRWAQADPFTMEVRAHPDREWLYCGRGSTDDKGPGLCAVWAASWALQQQLPIDVTVLWETEEEIGSPNFAEVVHARREQLDCDAVIVSDTIWPSDAQPAISAGLRGSLQAILRLRTAGKPAHSGLVGGAARNPVRELAALATAIDGARFWHDGVVPPSADELQGFLRSGFDLEYFKSAHDLHGLETDVPLEIMLRIWARPTFEVHGLTGGHMGPGVKTIVPDEAELKISFRLVPNQDPQALGARLEQFVHALRPDVEVDVSGFLQPYRGPTEGRVHEAIAAALTQATGRAPVTVREGGSIGAVPILADLLGSPVHFLPLSLPEHGYHAPNERFDWKQAKVGMTAFAEVFRRLSA